MGVIRNRLSTCRFQLFNKMFKDKSIKDKMIENKPKHKINLFC